MSALNTNTSAITLMAHHATQNVSGLWLRFRRYRLFRKTLTEMQAMSPRELADFGINKCDIHRIAHTCVYGCS